MYEEAERDYFCAGRNPRAAFGGFHASAVTKTQDKGAAYPDGESRCERFDDFSEHECAARCDDKMSGVLVNRPASADGMRTRQVRAGCLSPSLLSTVIKRHYLPWA